MVTSPCQLFTKRGRKAMSTKLEQAKQKLQFVSRALGNGYVDFDTLDELGREVSGALQLISEHEAAERCIEVANARQLPRDSFRAGQRLTTTARVVFLWTVTRHTRRSHD